LKKIVAGEVISSAEDYSPDMLIFNAKQNLSWKQRLSRNVNHFMLRRVEELSQQVEHMSARVQEMEEVFVMVELS
jgi:hypothetical protein